MPFIHIAANDRRRIGVWLRNQAYLCGCCLMILLIAQQASGIYTNSGSDDLGGISRRSPASGSIQLHAKPDALESDRDSSIAYAHHPQGWRKTAKGWEHTSNWFTKPRSLADLVASQEAQEPLWVAGVLALIRRASPITYATLQLAMIMLIVAWRKEKTA